MKQSAANTLDWTPDGREVVLGYDAGILRLEPMTHTGMALTGTVAFKLDALRTKQSTLDRDEERLRSDLANKESPVTLASRAKQLGLVPSRTPACHNP